GDLNGSIAAMKVTHSSIRRLLCSDKRELRGSLTFQDCLFQPVAEEEAAPFYSFATSLGTSFTNCVLHAPLVKGQRRYDLVDHFGFVVINRCLKYNHINTRIGRDISEHYRKRGEVFKPAF